MCTSAPAGVGIRYESTATSSFPPALSPVTPCAGRTRARDRVRGTACGTATLAKETG